MRAIHDNERRSLSPGGFLYPGIWHVTVDSFIRKVQHALDCFASSLTPLDLEPIFHTKFNTKIEIQFQEGYKKSRGHSQKVMKRQEL